MTTDNRQLINRLKEQQSLTKPEWIQLISGRTPELAEYLFLLAREERHRYYGHDVYVRGLIVSTAVSVKVMARQSATGLTKKRSCPAVRTDTGLDFGPSYYRAGRMLILQMRNWCIF